MISKVFFVISRLFYFLGHKTKIKSKSDIQKNRVKAWYEANGDRTLRLDYDLDENSLVLDLGGYEGQWTSDIFSKYCCNIYLFEPYDFFAKKIRNRFLENKKIKVFNFGLSKIDEIVNLNIAAEGSSIYRGKGEIVQIELKNVISFFKENEIVSIDLIKINIEGGEYDLIEKLLENEIINRIKNLQIQFHDFVPNAEQRMLEIQKNLSKTHFITYQYEFVWENWRLKEN